MFEQSTFTTNTAWQEGGVAYVHASNQFKVEGETTVAMNNASTGAGFILRGMRSGRSSRKCVEPVEPVCREIVF